MAMPYGRLVGEMDVKTYQLIRGELRKAVPPKINIDIKRMKDRKTIQIWSRYPEIVGKKIEELLK